MDSANLQVVVSDLLDHVRGMWRYRWWANGIAWAVFVVGWLGVCFVPDIYRGTTQVFVDTNSLLKPLMKGLTVTDNTLDEVQLVSKAVLTRPNLEKVARTTDLALRAGTPDAMEALVTDLQRRITVIGGRDNIFTIEYEDVSREMARAVVAALLDTFVESSKANQGTDTDVTEHALEGEIKNHEQRLRESEEALAKFKQTNLGYMPGEYGDYYNRLEAALTSVSEVQQKVHLLAERRDTLKRQIEGEEPVLGLVSNPVTAARSACADSSQIQQLRGQLAALLVQFTDKHPRVVTLQESIAHLQERCAAESKAAAANSPNRSAPPVGAESLDANPVYQTLKIQYNTAEVDLSQARTQLADNQNAVAALRRDVDKITEVEAQLKQLNRDYNVVQSRHQELLKRREDLMATKRLDPVTDNVQFRRIEPPFALANPVGPKRPMLLAAVLAIALGGGLAVAFAFNQLDPVYFTRKRLGSATAFPILGSISMILTPEAVAKRRAEAIAWAGAYFVLLVFTAIAVLFAGQASTVLRALTGGVGA